jgi:predicted nucleic acid-binding protein
MMTRYANHHFTSGTTDAAFGGVLPETRHFPCRSRASSSGFADTSPRRGFGWVRVVGAKQERERRPPVRYKIKGRMDMKAVFDSDIVIDFLQGNEHAKNEFLHYTEKLISVITFAEVMGGADDATSAPTRRFLTEAFRIVPVNEAIAEIAIANRKKHRLKLPDALIWGTAQFEKTILVTRNTKDFPETERSVRIPYKL